MKKLIVVFAILIMAQLSTAATQMPAPLQFFDNYGKVLSFGKVYLFEVGSTTPKAGYSDSTETVALESPITLNTAGRAQIWFRGCYKAIIKTSAGAVVETIDNTCESITSTPAISQWQASGITPVYVSSTSFSCTGDQTGTFENGLRIRSTNSNGTVYSTIASTSYAAGATTVTVVSDSGAFDSGLSSVDIAVINVANNSLPVQPVSTKTTSYTINPTDCGKTLVANFASAAAFTLPAANAVPSGCSIVTKATGSTLTLTGTVGGIVNHTLTEAVATIFSDGSVWRFKVHSASATNAAYTTPVSRADGKIDSAYIPDLFSSTTMTSGTGNPISMSVGNVTAGDIIFIDAGARLSSSATCSYYTSLYSSGTASVQFGDSTQTGLSAITKIDSPVLSQKNISWGSSDLPFYQLYLGQITQSGALTLSFSMTEVTATCTVQSMHLHSVFLKKQ